LDIVGFIWLADIVEKLWQKHHVEQHEVAEVFDDAPHFRFVEKGHREGENVYAALGQTEGGRYLIVFFVYKQDRSALVVSARDMTDAERKRYERR
jgi:uncharacterized DUF497 family protein